MESDEVFWYSVLFGLAAASVASWGVPPLLKALRESHQCSSQFSGLGRHSRVKPVRNVSTSSSSSSGGSSDVEVGHRSSRKLIIDPEDKDKWKFVDINDDAAASDTDLEDITPRLGPGRPQNPISASQHKVKQSHFMPPPVFSPIAPGGLHSPVQVGKHGSSIKQKVQTFQGGGVPEEVRAAQRLRRPELLPLGPKVKEELKRRQDVCRGVLARWEATGTFPKGADHA